MFGDFGNFDGVFGNFGRTPQKSDNTRYYKLLGVSQNATPEELRKAHKNSMLKNHPDKGGDRQKFLEIKEAYEVLKDPEKRKMYDQYGEDAVKDSMGNGAPVSMDDIFPGFFPRGMSSRPGGIQKSDNVTHKLKVSLEELYNGATKKLALQRQVKCSACAGVGTASGRKYQCNNCNGSGQEIRTMSFGPMVQQTLSPCSKCNGIGTKVPSSDKCKTCRSNGLIQERKVFEVYIEQGMKNGEKIIKRGEAGLSDPSYEPGDVIFTIETKPHPTFRRIHSDLVCEQKITLREALCGIDHQIRQLDNRILKVQSKTGQVIKPDSWMRISEEGLPIHGRPFNKGNMYIHFNVEFPEQISSEDKNMLEKILPGGEASGTNRMAVDCEEDEEEEVEMVQVDDIEEELKHRQQQERMNRSSEAYDSDSDEFQHRGGRTVECAHQ